jgi:sugar O-acyltransferase (sialic acid O-acetyltransferase NeuD family)
MKPLVIVGAGGHAREIAQIIADINASQRTWQICCFAVDREFESGIDIQGVPIIDMGELPDHLRLAHFVVAVGSSVLRTRLAARITEASLGRFATLIHPHAQVGPRVSIGEGSVVFPGAILTTDILLGSHVHINVAGTVSHDCRLGDYSTLGPHACCCGGVALEDGVELGAGAVVLPRVRIGQRTVVGAGAVVTKDLSNEVVAVGVPARPVPLQGNSDARQRA